MSNHEIFLFASYLLTSSDMNPEQDAINKLKQGNILGLEVLVNLYQLKAVRAADLIVRDVNLAQDIVQTAFLRAYERIDQFDSSRPFGPWFLRSVVNDALKSIQKRQRLVRLNLQTESLRSIEIEPEVAMEKEELSQYLWDALGKLSPQERAAVVMYYFLGYNSKELANEVNVPHGTIRWRLHHAINRLRDLLENWSKVV